MINQIGLAGFLVRGALGIMTQSALAEVCAAGNKNGVREFSVTRNGACLVNTLNGIRRELRVRNFVHILP